MNRIRDERGQAIVLTVLFITVLLGMAALVLDVGSWYRAQRTTQATADASALAAAQALPNGPGDPYALAQQYADKNGGGTLGVTFSARYAPTDTVSVKVNRDAPGIFAKLFGISSVDVGAKASARAAGLSSARWVAPIVVNIKHPKLNCGRDADDKPIPCFGESAVLELAHLHSPGSGDAAGAFGLINLDRDDSGSVGSGTLADWVLRGFDEYMDIGEYTSVPSAKFNSREFREALEARLNGTLLFPIYESITGSGSNAVYVVLGWVGFKVTSFKASGSTGEVKGSFTKVIWEGIQSESGQNLNFGARAIALVE